MQKDQYENSVVELLQVATETYIKKGWNKTLIQA